LYKFTVCTPLASINKPNRNCGQIEECARTNVKRGTKKGSTNANDDELRVNVESQGTQAQIDTN